MARDAVQRFRRTPPVRRRPMTATPSRPSHAEIATADRRSRAEMARLAASAVTVLTAAMTYVLAREQFDSRTALFATLTIALAPLTLVYGRMYNHEVFALFWVVTSTWAYLRWTKTRTPRDLARLGV